MREARADNGKVPGPLGVRFCDGAPRGLKVKAWGNSCIHSKLPNEPLTRMRKPFSTPAAAWVTQKLPRAPLLRRSMALA